jgi:DNA anti-recombination protein RmuC
VNKVARRNLRMFGALCGNDGLKHSVIVTTFWDSVTEEVGSRREKELRDDATLFKALLDNGAQTMRHDSQVESAKKIMEHVVCLPQVVLQVQDELSRGIALKDTGAGRVMEEQIRELQEGHRKRMEELRREMEDAAEEKNQALLAELAEERKEAAAAVKKNQAEIDKLGREANGLLKTIFLAIFGRG